MSGGEDERKAKFDAYWCALQPLGPERIIAVCQRALCGEIGNPSFLPTVAELFQDDRKHVWAPSRPKLVALSAPSKDNRPLDEINRVAGAFKVLSAEFSESFGKKIPEDLGTTRSLGAVIRALYENGEKEDQGTVEWKKNLNR